jgi:hypothetical protein
MPPIPKPVRIRDKVYLGFIRRLPCVLAQLSKCQGPVEAMHVISKGAGGGDHLVAPGCVGHHRGYQTSFHIVGAKTFDRFYGIDLAQIARDIRREYVETHPEPEESAA